MRFLSTLFLLSALPALPVLARMNHLVSRTSHDHPVIAHRQYQPMRTSLADICAAIDISLLPKISALGILEASASLELQVCICISLVPTFVKADVRIKSYVDHVGEQNAVINIKELIKAADGRQTCGFPPHSIPLLSTGTSCDPCAYKCEDTYHNRDGQCVCHAPSFECNGKCALACGSSTPKELSDAWH